MGTQEDSKKLATSGKIKGTEDKSFNLSNY